MLKQICRVKTQDQLRGHFAFQVQQAGISFLISQDFPLKDPISTTVRHRRRQEYRCQMHREKTRNVLGKRVPVLALK